MHHRAPSLSLALLLLVGPSCSADAVTTGVTTSPPASTPDASMPATPWSDTDDDDNDAAAAPVPVGGAADVCGNGLDDDRDGRIDDGCGCVPGQTQPCYPGDPAEVGRGLCRMGLMGCEGSGEFGTWTECVGAVVPRAEDCGDGVDDDCDGVPDDGACSCAAGESRACYDGPAVTRGVGICRDGVQACVAGPMPDWGVCLDQVLPREDICGNGLDDDCNGAADDGPGCACAPGELRSCYGGPAVEIGVGICRAGTQRCTADGRSWTMCEGEVGPTSETCANGIDEDCDGSADEGCESSMPPAVVEVPIAIFGDCQTVRCPPEAPYPVGCTVFFTPGDDRGCVASRPDSPVVYFQAGDECNAGLVTGTLRCSTTPGAPLDQTSCRINKPVPMHPSDRSGCPATHD